MLAVDPPHPGVMGTWEGLQVITLHIYACLWVVMLPKFGPVLAFLVIGSNNCEVPLNFNRVGRNERYINVILLIAWVDIHV